MTHSRGRGCCCIASVMNHQSAALAAVVDGKPQLWISSAHSPQHAQIEWASASSCGCWKALAVDFFALFMSA
eukprot:3164338-Amphidinium_carterae.1